MRAAGRRSGGITLASFATWGSYRAPGFTQHRSKCPLEGAWQRRAGVHDESPAGLARGGALEAGPLLQVDRPVGVRGAIAARRAPLEARADDRLVTAALDDPAVGAASL